jgi:hypothetical protein
VITDTRSRTGSERQVLPTVSMTTSQRYVAAAGTETRNAAAKNPLYAVLDSANDHRRVLTIISMLLANS